MSAELVKLLRVHRDEQDRERQLAAQLWQEAGWVFTSPTGQPVNPSTDYHEWKRLLGAASVREARLHDARPTAATVLLVLGVPERAVMSLMGWADTGMAKRYQHVTGRVRMDVAARIGGLLWSGGVISAKPARCRLQPLRRLLELLDSVSSATAGRRPRRELAAEIESDGPVGGDL